MASGSSAQPTASEQLRQSVIVSPVALGAAETAAPRRTAATAAAAKTHQAERRIGRIRLQDLEAVVAARGWSQGRTAIIVNKSSAERQVASTVNGSLSRYSSTDSEDGYVFVVVVVGPFYCY